MRPADEERIAKHGPYYIMKTLLGATPDCNRRIIYDLRNGDWIETHNYEMATWTDEMEAALKRRVKELNDEYLRKAAS